MNSYQPASLDFPFSSQVPDVHPYSQNFPDEPDSESFQVQVPSAENNQQINPEDSFSCQKAVQVAYPSQSHPLVQAPYQPQYLMVADSKPVDPQKRRLEEKIEHFEERLKSGWYMAYKVWLYMNIIFCLLMIFCFWIWLVVSVVLYLQKPEGKIGIMEVDIWLSATWSIWLLQQCVVVKNAMNDRSLEGAKRGLRSMIWFSFYYLVTFFAPLLFGEERLLIPYDQFFVAFLIMYMIPTFVKLFGAIKVLNLLEEREPLVVQLNENFRGKFL